MCIRDRGTATNFIVTMNNTQAWDTGPANTFSEFSSTEWKRVSITGTTTSGSFNIHLGSSFNTGFSDTIQTGGTILIQDVRLQLTSSQTAIQDLVDQNTIAATSLTYASDGTFSFDGSSNYITVPHSADIQPVSGVITTIVWFKATGSNGQDNSILINKENEYEISAGGGNISLAFRPNWAWVGHTAFSLNTWYCVAVTYDQSYQKMYINGVERYSAALSGAMGAYTEPLKIGARGGAASTYAFFPGYISIVQIYNRGLSALEVLQNFNALRGRYGI